MAFIKYPVFPSESYYIVQEFIIVTAEIIAVDICLTSFVLHSGCCTATETVVPLLSNCYNFFFHFLKK